MRGSRVKLEKRQLHRANVYLANAAGANADIAWSFIFQAFWQSVALAALLAYLEPDEEAPADTYQHVADQWAKLEQAVHFWPSNVVI